MGRFVVLVDGSAITESAWKTDKNKALAKILITNRRRVTCADELADWLWPRLPPEAAARNLRVAVSQARRAFEPGLTRGSASRYLVSTPTGYAWNEAAGADLDVERFEAACTTFESGFEDDPATAPLAAAETALTLYQGDYLAEDRYEDWPVAERERLAERYYGLLGTLAEVYARKGRYRRAIALCRDLLARDRCRESIWRKLMLYLAHSGDAALALRAFEECVGVLAEELGVAPLAETEALADAIRRRTLAFEPSASTYGTAAGTFALPPLPSFSSVPLVGRQRALAQLLAAWQRARAGGLAIVLIEGEAGLGKTHLARELLRQASADGGLVVQGQAFEHEAMIDGGPLTAALRGAGGKVAAIAGTLPPALATALGQLLPELAPAASRRDGTALGPDAIHEAVSRLLEELREAQAAPALVVFIDDLQWADRRTAAFLAYLARRGLGRCLIVLARRPEDVTPDSPADHCVAALEQLGVLERVGLAPLDEAALTELILRVSFDSPDATGLARRLWAATHGHPLYSVALLQALFEDDLCQVDQDGAWRVAPGFLDGTADVPRVPMPVLELVRRRVGRLSTASRRLLSTAAVIGRPFSIALGVGALGEPADTVIDLAGELVDRRLLRCAEDGGPDRYAVVHDLVRRAVYDHLLPEQRIALHRSVLAALDADNGPVAERVHHAMKGEDWSAAIRAGIPAASAANRRLAIHEGLWLAEQGLAACDHLAAEAVGNAELGSGTVRGDGETKLLATERFDLLDAAHHARELLGERDVASAAKLLASAKALDDPERLARAYFGRLRHHHITGQNQEALAIIPAYRAVIARGVWPETELNFHHRHGLLLYRLGHLDQAQAALDRALECAERSGDPLCLGTARNTRGLILMCRGQYGGALDEFDRASADYRSAGAPLLAWLPEEQRSDVLYYLGAYAESLAIKAAALPVFRDLAHRLAELECHWEIGWLLVALDRLDEARTWLDEAEALAFKLEARYHLVQTYIGLAMLEQAAGNARRALDFATQAIAEARAIDAPHGIILGLAAQAKAHLALGEPDAALATSQAAADRLAGQGYIEGAEEEVYLVHARALVANDRLEDADAYFRRAHDELQRKAMTLDDPELRATFLGEVDANRCIVAAWQARLPASKAPLGDPFNRHSTMPC